MKNILSLFLTLALVSCASYPTKQEQLEMNKDTLKHAKVWQEKLKADTMKRAKYIASQKAYYDVENNQYTVKEIKYNTEISWFMPVDKNEKFLVLDSEIIYNSADIVFTNVKTGHETVLRFNFYYDLVCEDRACYNTFTRESRTAITSEWVKNITRFEYRMYKVSRIFDDIRPQSTLLKFLYTDSLEFNSALEGRIVKNMTPQDVWFSWGRPYQVKKDYKHEGQTATAYKYRLRDSIKKEWVIFKNNKVEDFKYTFEEKYELHGPYEDVYKNY